MTAKQPDRSFLDLPGSIRFRIYNFAGLIIRSSPSIADIVSRSNLPPSGKTLTAHSIYT